MRRRDSRSRSRRPARPQQKSAAAPAHEARSRDLRRVIPLCWSYQHLGSNDEQRLSEGRKLLARCDKLGISYDNIDSHADWELVQAFDAALTELDGTSALDPTHLKMLIEHGVYH